jgi:small subunit ribosomal protein S17
MSQVSNEGGQEQTKVSFVGIVESDKRDKSRKVVVRYAAKHPKYGKFIQRQTVIHAHDEANEARQGDTVEVVPCRPMSKTKNWRIARIVERKQTV